MNLIKIKIIPKKVIQLNRLSSFQINSQNFLSVVKKLFFFVFIIIFFEKEVFKSYEERVFFKNFLHFKKPKTLYTGVYLICIYNIGYTIVYPIPLSHP